MFVLCLENVYQHYFRTYNKYIRISPYSHNQPQLRTFTAHQLHLYDIVYSRVVMKAIKPSKNAYNSINAQVKYGRFMTP